jgi:two-component system, chemotaxis family, CheB/CheR fusion protein
MSTANKDKVKIQSANLFPVVGIGASAGGLDAFKRLVKAIPENSGMAYILVQHLDPTHESILTDLLQKVTTIPVQEITDNIHVVADHIYIIPSNKLLTATDGVLKLSARPPKSHRNMPIDLFFSSLAEVHQSHAIGVVLSGTATDGTLGLKAIKEHGGITIAQELQSAAYDGMPQSAIDANVVDYILPPEEIPGQLLVLNKALESGRPDSSEEIQKVDEEEFKQILSLLRIRKGIDFTYYRQTTIRRRINRRVALSNKENLFEYLADLRQNQSELDILYQDLLIPVTEFFRDVKVFENLNEKIFPALFKNRAVNESIRFWIAGCSTGEEAYSIIMCLHEYLGERVDTFKIQVFATDISESAIAKARTGIYKKSEVTGLTAPRMQKFFSSKDGGFLLNKSIRDTCVFAYHNFLKDPPFARIDLISCRNSLIYMEPNLQKKALTTFHYALNENGFLLLGKSETASQVADLFNVFEKQSKIYTRKAVKGRFLHEVAERKEEISHHDKFGSSRNEINKDDFQKNADEVFISKYSPPGVVVNNELDIVQFRGPTSTWLEPSSGKPNLNVLKMAREGLAFEMRNALYKSKISKKAEIKEDIPIQFMGMEKLVSIEVIPLLNTLEPHFLILFRDTSLSSGSARDQTKEIQTGGSPALNKDKIQIHKLQQELAQLREDMRNITEDQEASNEELQSANEELLSGSEELQSLNEELETVKEETQTSNEELIIVNQELYDRNEQLNLSRLYSESIVTTIREPLIILNKNLQVKSANKSFYAKFNSTPEATEGKHLFELSNKLWNIKELREMLGKVLPEQLSIVDYEVTLNLPNLGERIMLLNASTIFIDNSEEQLILLASEDITEKRKVDNALHLFSEELEKKVAERTLSLHEANIELQHSNKNLEQFAYIASHDLQEPLRKIRTYSSILQSRNKNDLPNEVMGILTKIETSAERMSNLITDVLNFSKILHHGETFEETDLNGIITEVINDFDLLIADKHAIIRLDRLPVIDAIPLQITQLFYNLVSNSLKFTKNGTDPVITITSRIVEGKDFGALTALDPTLSYCEISITDNGIGFDQKYSDQIFLIFHRLHGREHYMGTGIGLALCKSIVANHNGEIVCVSNKNEGASFKIILPVFHGNKV